MRRQQGNALLRVAEASRPSRNAKPQKGLGRKNVTGTLDKDVHRMRRRGRRKRRARRRMRARRGMRWRKWSRSEGGGVLAEVVLAEVAAEVAGAVAVAVAVAEQGQCQCQ